eukprot:COSAG06_NODE_410_length_16089_cov_9.968793_4_plen_57_part_00
MRSPAWPHLVATVPTLFGSHVRRPRLVAREVFALTAQSCDDGGALVRSQTIERGAG